MQEIIQAFLNDINVEDKIYKEYINNNVEDKIYNEFSLQHELGIFLRKKLKKRKYRVDFERNKNFFFERDNSHFCKSEIDIAIYNKNENKCVIELKFPKNGQYPETMYSTIKDIRFLEQLTKGQDSFEEGICVFITEDRLFWEGKKREGIYSYFRDSNAKIQGQIMKPTGPNKGKEKICICGNYKIEWKDKDIKYKYFIIKLTQRE